MNNKEFGWWQGSCRWLIVLILLLPTIVFTTAQAATAKQNTVKPKLDMRVLVDVSGSMKESDPDNLRRSALRMLSGLLPDGSRAGVWTFGRYVNMQVPHGTVDKKWRKKVQTESEKIYSYGLYTNIEGVLVKSTWDWKQADKRYKRRMILLSDGMVDMSKDAAVNKRIRNRIINKVLPLLKKAGVQIHTIALSKNADQDLMKKLAKGTGGKFVYAENADSLNRIFLRLFERATNATALPIKKNKFLVDKSVDDMTVLVFHSKDKRPTRLLTPTLKAMTQAKRPSSVSWHQEDQFDLITVKKPAAGKWSIEAAMDPDNRVLVVTNLKLDVAAMPDQVFAGESIGVKAQLLQNAKPVSEKSLLDRVTFSADQLVDGEAKKEITLTDKGKQGDAQADDGNYAGRLTMKLGGKDSTQVRIIAKGPTFEREIKREIVVNAIPLKLEVGKLTAGPEQTIPLSVTVNKDAGKIIVQSARLQIPASKAEPILFKKGEKGIWAWSAPVLLAGQTVEISATLKAKDGRVFTLSWQHTLPRFEGQIKQAIKEKEAEPAAEEVVAEATKKPMRWPLVISLVVLLNAVLGLIGLGGYLWWRKRQSTSEPDETELAYE